MLRETDNTYPNPPDDMPRGPFMLPWTRKPLGKPKSMPGKGMSRQPKSKSGFHNWKRVTHPDPFF